MDLLWIIQTLVGLAIAVGAFLYKDLKAKADKTQEELLSYKTHVAEVYATQPQLTRALDSFINQFGDVKATMSRIEERLYKLSHTTNN